VFAELLKERSLEWCLTAHNANDVAETLLMRLLANKELTSIEESDERRKCLRPLLSIPRSDIDEYVTTWGLEYREDPTNQDVSFTRNRVRHRLLPLLRSEFDDSILYSLADRAQAIALDESCLRDCAANHAARLGAIQEQSYRYLTALQNALEALHEGLRWRVVEILLLPVLGYPLGRRKAVPIVACVEAGTGEVHLTEGRIITVSSDGMQVNRI
jgi:tRNA(Ile)-lysidine synthase TilS/MesJ